MSGADLFPEVEPDPVAAARRRMFSRHQHAGIADATNNERFTLRPTLDLCMRLADVEHIDIDTAACPEAHCAPVWMGRQADGSWRDALSPAWRWGPAPVDANLFRPTVGWNNPPYALIPDFIERSALAMLDGELDVLLSLPPGDRCEQPWWHKWIEPYRDGRGLLGGCVRIDTHPLPGRQKFGSPGDPLGLTADQAPFPSLLIVWRRSTHPHLQEARP